MKEELVSASNTMLTRNDLENDQKIQQETPDTAQRRNNISQDMSSTIKRINKQTS